MDSQQAHNTPFKEVTDQQVIMRFFAILRDTVDGTFTSGHGDMFVKCYCQILETVRSNGSKPPSNSNYELLHSTGITEAQIIEIWEGQPTTVKQQAFTGAKEVDIYPQGGFKYDREGNCINCFPAGSNVKFKQKSVDKVKQSLAEDNEEVEIDEAVQNIKDVLTIEDFKVKLEVESPGDITEQTMAVKSYYQMIFGKMPSEDKTKLEWMQKIVDENQRDIDQVTEKREKMEAIDEERKEVKKSRQHIKDRAKKKRRPKNK